MLCAGHAGHAQTKFAAATPTFSPVAGSYGSAQKVTISDTTSGATIYYTTNGTTPTTSSSVYSSPITVSATETVEAIAVETGYGNSAVGSAAYTITSAPTVSITTSGTPLAYGTAVTFTATVTTGDTNVVTFLDGSTALGTATPSGGSASVTTRLLAVGSHSITATIAAGGNYSSATSSALTQVVSQATPTISVTSSGTPSTYGSSVTLTATVISGDTNTVTFYSGTTSLGTATPSGGTGTFNSGFTSLLTLPVPRDGTATLTTSSLAAGSSDSITATIAAGGNYLAATSSAITQVVNKATPALTVSTSGTPSTYGGSVTFTATIPSGPAGTVTFYDGAAALGTGTISARSATFTTSTLSAGTHTISVGCAGTSNYSSATSSSITQTVNLPVTPTITNLSPSSAATGAAVTITGTEFGSGNTVKFNGVAATTINVLSSTSIIAVVPVRATTGNVVVTTSAGASNGSPFTVLSSPTITSLSPTSGATGTPVTIIGTNFGTTAGTVTFNGIVATPITGSSWTNTSIVVAVPAGSSAGSAFGPQYSDVVVTANGGTSNSVQFYVTTPTITSLSPSTSPPSGTVKQAVTIEGWNFGTTQGTVTVNGQPATVYYWGGGNAIESISFYVPAGATTGNVVVTTGAGASNPLLLTVLQAPTLSVVSSATPSPSGGSVTFTATIANGPASGIVTFYDGATGIGTGAINGTTATYTTNTLAPGSHAIAAVYPGSSSYNSVTSNPITEQIGGQITLPGPGIINTIAGVGTEGFNGDSFAAASAELSGPFGITVDGTGNVYFADSGNCVIRKVTISTANIDTIVGKPYGSDSSDQTQARPTSCGFGYLPLQGVSYSVPDYSALYWPSDMAIGPSSNIYIADTYNNLVAETTYYNGVSGNKWYIAPFAGITQGLSSQVGEYNSGSNDNWGYSGDGGAATSATLYGPTGLALDGAGNLYIADTDNNVIRKVNTSGIISTIVGNGTQGYSGDNGPATSATLTWPIGIALDTSGNLYIADEGNNVIRKVTFSNGVGTITTVAGNGTQGYDGDDGLATSAELSGPAGVAVDTAGNLYIADTNNNAIREVTAASGIISTLAGDGTAGYLGDGGLATSAELSAPGGVAVDASGNIYISDTQNQRIRVVGASKTIPTIAWDDAPAINYGTVLTGGTAPLNATAGAISGTFSYTIASSSLASTPASGTTPKAGTYTLSVTFSPSDTIHYATATTTVTLTVSQIPAPIAWATPAPITDSTALSTTQLNATSPATGTWAYSPGIGTSLAPGPHLLTVTLTPTDTVDYLPSTATVSITVASGASADAGTVTLTVNTGTPSAPNLVTAATTTYSAGATPSTIAAGLAAGVTAGSPVKITAVDDDVYIQATATGMTSNYPYSLQSSGPSFLSLAITGTLEGGADAQPAGTPSTVYSYEVPAPGGYDGDSNLIASSDSVMGTWNFSYDTLNRLSTTTAATNAPAPYAGNYGCWSYDAFGNRTSQSMSTTSCGSNPALASWAQYNGTINGTNNNQMSATSQNLNQAYGYDSAGNVLNDGTNQYLYDGAGRICAVASTPIPSMTTMTGYLYDASGTRVAKGSITAWSCDPVLSGFKTINDYVLGLNGEQVSEMGVNSTAGSGSTTLAWQHSNVYAGGTLIATYDADGLHFYLNDPLGTRRVQTDYAGVVERQCSSLPFGDGETCTPTPTEHLFTGKERDAESGNDYFGARYYSSAMGRFMSPDPSQLYYADPTNPQSFNLYAYAQNNPLINTDPTGFECVWDNGSYDDENDPDTGQSSNGGCAAAGGTWMELGQGGNWSNAGNQGLANLTQIQGISGAALDDSGNVQMYSVGTNSFNANGTPFQNSVADPTSPTFSLYGFASGGSDSAAVQSLNTDPYGNLPMIPNLSMRDPNAPPPLPKFKKGARHLCLWGQQTNEMAGGEGGPTAASDTAPGRGGAAQIPFNYYSRGGNARSVNLVSEEGDAKLGGAQTIWDWVVATTACFANSF